MSRRADVSVELDAYGENCIVHPPLDCVACYLQKCPLSVTCMDLLTPELVWTRVADWRKGLRRPRQAVALKVFHDC